MTDTQTHRLQRLRAPGYMQEMVFFVECHMVHIHYFYNGVRSDYWNWEGQAFDGSNNRVTIDHARYMWDKMVGNGWSRVTEQQPA